MADLVSLFNNIKALQESRLNERDHLRAAPGQPLARTAPGVATAHPGSVSEAGATATRVAPKVGLACQFHGAAQSLADSLAGVGAVDVIMSDSGEVEFLPGHWTSTFWVAGSDDADADVDLGGSDDEADDEDSELSQYEEIDDTEVLAEILLRSCLCPSARARTLVRRAASGKGPNAQLLRASGMI